MKKVYIAATRKNDGKTAVTLGLALAFKEICPGPIGFIKPVGQPDYRSGAISVDQDVLLIERATQVHCGVEEMGPIMIDRAFAETYFARDDASEAESLMVRIRHAFEAIGEGKELVVIEGSGHACAGGIFGLSNAHVAKELGAKVVLVASGGVGHPLDEIALNVFYFQEHGVHVEGVIFNRAFPHEIEVLETFGRRAVERMGTRLLGVIPHEPHLLQPSLLQVLKACKGELLNGEEAFLDARVDTIQIGSMSAHLAIDRFADDALLIVAGDRADMILAAIATREDPGAADLAGLVLTCDIRPPDAILRLIRNSSLPTLLVEDDSFTVAERITQMPVKIDPGDTEKIELATHLVRQAVDTKALYEAL